MSTMAAVRTRPVVPTWVVVSALLVVVVLVVYRETVTGLVSIWWRSDTFAHCLLVPPIVLWLLWRQRQEICAQQPVPAPWVLLPMAGAGLLWLLGNLASADVVSQLAVVLIIIMIVPAVAGLGVARTMAFPLGFLLFAVPIGEFMLPWFMERTADFTVFALRASGIPVFRDGLQFIIPSGSWSVIEACSGVRYLIASVFVGTLFAYLSYRSLKRRLVFILVAVLVPIVANWLRAYMIVMIGHLSSNKLATGVDHVIYGWLFFGFVIILMFMVGARWSEPRAVVSRPSPVSSLPRVAVPWATVAAGIAVLVAPSMAYQAVVKGEDTSLPRLLEPAFDSAAWVPSGSPAWSPSAFNPTVAWQQRYVSAGRSVGLYLGYYRRQDSVHRLVSSQNVLAPSTDHGMVQVGAGLRQVPFGPAAVTMRTARLRQFGGPGEKSLVIWQVYWVNGVFTSSDALAKAYGAVYRLLGRGDDAAVVIVHAFEDRPGDADEVMQAFLRDNFASMSAQLLRTRDGD